jgi:hypothetical protein
MATSQTLLTIAALVLLSVALLSFNGTVAQTGSSIDSAQDGILETTIATSFLEIAQGLAFDEVTDSSDIAITNMNSLTSPWLLGPDSSSENSIYSFDDFDDFNGATLEKAVSGNGHRYRAQFSVHYVDPSDALAISYVRTFVKRMDLKIWRIAPPLRASSPSDTLRMSLVMGYFHFD